MMLSEGAVIERLRRDPRARLDPALLNAGLLYDREQAGLLASLHREYLDIGRDFSLPMLALTDTWRASPERIGAAGLGGRDVNGDAFRFLAAIREEYGDYARSIRIGGLMGCRGDAYEARQALGAEDAMHFHGPQAEALARAGVDCLVASTLPALSEALGLARAMAATGLPYLLSFVVRPNGALLDGTPLREAVSHIDGALTRPPEGYLVNCVHAEVFRSAMRAAGSPRVIGLQANTSRKSPEELEGSPELDTQDPAAFAAAFAALQSEFPLEIMGGCCGTDARHIRALAEAVAGLRGGHRRPLS